VIGIVLVVGGILITLFPPQKPNPKFKIDIAGLLPETISAWKSHTYDTKDYQDQWQSINQLLVRTYYLENEKRFVDLYLEYSSDVRRAFSFHFPENCYRAGGNEIIFLKPLEIKLSDGRILKAKSIFVKGLTGKREESDKLVAYWVILDGKHFYNMFGIKIDQMLAGLFSKAREGFLVRVDVREGVDLNKDNQKIAGETIRRFINDLFDHLPEKQRNEIFGKF
jgi:EpsI family protein